MPIMTIDQQKSILTVCLMAAFSDGGNDARERDQLKQITDSLAGDGGSTADVISMVKGQKV